MYWLDIETTGLDANRDRILEIGMMATDDDLGLVSTSHIFKDVLIASTVPEQMIDPFVRDMHTKSGLFHDLRQPGTRKYTASQAEAMLVKWLHSVEPGATKRTLAGSSVHFDRKFLDHYMPTLSAMFSHRHADVSAMREFVQRWHPTWRAPEATAAHRPSLDILDSINLARSLRAVLKENQ